MKGIGKFDLRLLNNWRLGFKFIRMLFNMKFLSRIFFQLF